MSSMLRDYLVRHGFCGRYSDYRPQFWVEEIPQEGWWIYDGDTQVGLVLREHMEGLLVNHDPLAPRAAVEFPEIYHAPNMPGDRITLVAWPDLEEGVRREHRELRLDMTDDSVCLTTEEQWSDGRSAQCRATWLVDEDFGYIVACEILMVLDGKEKQGALHEFCNFLPKGVTDDRPESGRRYPHVLWRHPSGTIYRWNQNNVGARSLGAMDHFGQRLIETGGFLGFFGESDYGVAVEIIETAPDVTAITCPNLLDEHLLWLPGVELTRRAKYNMVRVPDAVGAELTALAELIDPLTDKVYPEREEYNRVRLRDYPYESGAPYTLPFYPIALGEVCDFETPVDPTAPFRGQAFPYRENSEDAISVVEGEAHTGRRSLRVRVDGDIQRAFAIGGCLHVTRGQKYRLSAWIKSELQNGSAELLGLEYLFARGNVTAEHRAKPERIGEWQRVAVEFAPGEKAHVVDVCFDVNGQGQAWIDEILLEQIDTQVE